MPWKELTTMSQRAEFVRLTNQEGTNFSDLCRRFGISRPTGYKWLERHLNGESLSNKSRRPYFSPNQTKKPIEDEIIKVRLKHPAWGGRKIKAFLTNKGFSNLPSPSTITAILKRNSLVDPEESLKHCAFQRFEKTEPNELWQMDFKGYFSLDEGGYCHPLTVLDDHSRFLLGLAACPNETSQTLQNQLSEVFLQYGLPKRMLMDNGSPWGDDWETRHTIFTAWLIRLGISVTHGRPYHPQTQGKDERLHRTLKDELLSRKSLPNLATCQTAFEDWRYLYNYERPHESLGMQPPSSRYKLSLKPFPEVLPPILYDDDCLIRKVDQSGKIYFQGYSFRVGKAFRYHPVGLRPTEIDGTYNVYFCSQIIAKIDLTLV
jgi:transposase InsO family protein